MAASSTPPRPAVSTATSVRPITHQPSAVSSASQSRLLLRARRTTSMSTQLRQTPALSSHAPSCPRRSSRPSSLITTLLLLCFLFPTRHPSQLVGSMKWALAGSRRPGGSALVATASRSTSSLRPRLSSSSGSASPTSMTVVLTTPSITQAVSNPSWPTWRTRARRARRKRSLARATRRFLRLRRRPWRPSQRVHHLSTPRGMLSSTVSARFSLLSFRC